LKDASEPYPFVTDTLTRSFIALRQLAYCLEVGFTKRVALICNVENTVRPFVTYQFYMDDAVSSGGWVSVIRILNEFEKETIPILMGGLGGEIIDATEVRSPYLG
jgi:hypothetical protein